MGELQGFAGNLKLSLAVEFLPHHVEKRAALCHGNRVGGHYLWIFRKTWPDEFAYGLDAQGSARAFEQKLVCLRVPDANHYRKHSDGALKLVG